MMAAIEELKGKKYIYADIVYKTWSNADLLLFLYNMKVPEPVPLVRSS